MAVGARFTIQKSRTIGTSERPRTYHLAREVGEVRAPVARFAIAIENALRRNDAEKGGEAEWRKLSLLDGFEGIEDEIRELAVEIGRRDARRVKAEVADVGAWSAILFDLARRRVCRS